MDHPTTYIAIEGFYPDQLTDEAKEELVAQVHSTVQEKTDLDAGDIIVMRL